MTGESDPETIGHARRGLFELYRRQGRRVWVQGSGHSMRPLIPPGGWLLVEFGAVPDGVGEIIVFAHQGMLVAHRVVVYDGAALNMTVTTKGDSQLSFDPPLPVGDVIGVVRAVRRAPHSRVYTIACSGAVALLAGWLSRTSARAAGRLRIFVLGHGR
jgi:hypothetical protein